MKNLLSIYLLIRILKKVDRRKKTLVKVSTSQFMAYPYWETFFGIYYAKMTEQQLFGFLISTKLDSVWKRHIECGRVSGQISALYRRGK